MPSSIPNLSAPLCDCGLLKGLSQIEKSPILFDERLNEYRIRGWDFRGEPTEWMVYHCFFCGGRTPESRRRKTMDPSDFMYGTEGKAMNKEK